MNKTDPNFEQEFCAFRGREDVVAVKVTKALNEGFSIVNSGMEHVTAAAEVGADPFIHWVHMTRNPALAAARKGDGDTGGKQ